MVSGSRGYFAYDGFSLFDYSKLSQCVPSDLRPESIIVQHGSSRSCTRGESPVPIRGKTGMRSE